VKPKNAKRTVYGRADRDKQYYRNIGNYVALGHASSVLAFLQSPSQITFLNAFPFLFPQPISPRGGIPTEQQQQQTNQTKLNL
jgi:hypothetical protein